MRSRFCAAMSSGTPPFSSANVGLHCQINIIEGFQAASWRLPARAKTTATRNGYGLPRKRRSVCAARVLRPEPARVHDRAHLCQS